MALLQMHATTVVIGDRGVLIAGESGAGKSTLALALVRRAMTAAGFAALVVDDRTDLDVRSGRLVASAPAPIAGLVEIHGLGPRPASHLDRAVIDLLVRLVEPRLAPRYQEGEVELVAGCPVPRLTLPHRQADPACSVLLSWFGLPPY